MALDSAAALDALLAREFPPRAQGVYANHAAIAPWPRCAVEAVRRFAAENTADTPADYRAWIERETGLRAGLARLIGAASSDDVALLKNTTEGISVVAFGLDWRAGDNVVLPAAEFPSNRLPWLAQRTLGVALREVDVRAADDAEQALIDAMDERTRLLTVSAVQWNDGFRLDLRRLGAACRERGVLFFVDAIQHLGALSLDVTACCIDFLAADAHKWLLGPEGVAVFFSTASARPQLRLLQQGWHMFDYPWAFDRSDWTPAGSARRFEPGSPNSLGQAALAESVRLLEQVRPATVEQRVLANTQRVLDGLSQLRDAVPVSRPEPERRSGIVSFRPRHGSAAGLHRALRQRHVDVALRGQAVRLSPHFYQGAAVIERLLAAVAEALAELD